MKTERVQALGARLGELLGKYKFVLLVILAGAALLLLPSGGGERTEEAASAGTETAGDLFGVADLEARLEQALAQIDGVGEVDVVLTLRSGPRQVLAQDTDTSHTGDGLDTTLSTVVVSRGSGSGEEPVTLQQISPQYQGALVVCSGGDDPSVRLELVEAISALTGLGADRISVCKGK